MPVTLDISYYNTFLIKQVTSRVEDNPTNIPVWPKGFNYNEEIAISPEIGPFPGNASSLDSNNSFYLEESRIRGGYNNTSVDFGVKAYLVDENAQQQHRKNSLIWSGIFNSRTGINNSNQFPTGESIIKSVDPAEGSIQKLHAEDTNLIILQENQVSRAPIDKDIIYNAEGGGVLTTSNTVIGTISAYSGEYGISKNPESFAVYGYQKYFTDKDRNVVLRLSKNGLTEITEGMIDYFRDQLSSLPDSSNLIIPATVLSSAGYVINLTSEVENIHKGMSFTINGVAQPNNRVVDVSTDGTQVTTLLETNVVENDDLVFSAPFRSLLLGGYDIYNKNYTLSIQQKPTWAAPLSEDIGFGSSSNYNTLSFDERVGGWTSYFTYKPTYIFSLKNNFYSFKEGKLYRHYSNETGLNRNNFYNVYNPSKITFILNDQPSLYKNFQTVNYEGDNGWQVDFLTSDKQGPDYSSPWGDWSVSQDVTNAAGGISVKSYLGGAYDSLGNTFPTTLIPPIYHYGFERKENKYYAIIYNNSAATSGEVIYGQQISGIKGRFATVTISTDDITQVGGSKELWSVGSKYVFSS
jgi:hypothetical protein